MLEGSTLAVFLAATLVLGAVPRAGEEAASAGRRRPGRPVRQCRPAILRSPKHVPPSGHFGRRCLLSRRDGDTGFGGLDTEPTPDDTEPEEG